MERFAWSDDDVEFEDDEEGTDLTEVWAKAHQDEGTFQIAKPKKSTKKAPMVEEPSSPRFVWSHGGVVVTLALEDDHKEFENDVLIGSETVNQTADRLEPDVVKEFEKTVRRLRKRIPAERLAEAVAKKDVRHLEEIFSDEAVANEFTRTAEKLHDAAIRGATGAPPSDKMPPEIWAQVTARIDAEMDAYVEEVTKNIKDHEDQTKDGEDEEDEETKSDLSRFVWMPGDIEIVPSTDEKE